MYAEEAAMYGGYLSQLPASMGLAVVVQLHGHGLHNSKVLDFKIFDNRPGTVLSELRALYRPWFFNTKRPIVNPC